MSGCDAVSKYDGGCDPGQGRGQCVYDKSPIGTIRLGKTCGLWSWIKINIEKLT